jgi:hypothetical protein
LDKKQNIVTNKKKKKEVCRVLNDDFEDSTPCSYSVYHETEDDKSVDSEETEDEIYPVIEAAMLKVVEDEFVKKPTLRLSPRLSIKKSLHECKKRRIELKDANVKKKNRIEVTTRDANVTNKNRMEVKTGEKTKKRSDTVTIVTIEEDNVSHNDSYDDYEIPRDYTKEFVNSNKRKLKRCKPELYGIGNHRKGRGYEGELLMLYTDGTRYWGFLAGPLEEFSGMTYKYLKDNNLTCEMMGFGLYYDQKPIQQESVKKARKGTKKGKGKKKVNKLAIDKGNIDSDIQITNLPNEADLPKIPESIMIEELPKEAYHLTEGPTTTEEIAMNDTVIDNESNGNKTMDDEVESVIEPFICMRKDNHNAKFLKSSDCSKYCTNKLRFDGAKCAMCGTLFVHKIIEEKRCFKATVRLPMYCCDNAKEYCSYALCHPCQITELNKNSKC